MKRILATIALTLVAFALIANPSAEPRGGTGEAAAGGVIKNPDTFIYASYGTVDSLDPVKAYDNASGACVQSIYETLISYAPGSTEVFVPVLATEVPTVENGGITNDGKTYRFNIRKGVKFHSGNELTPEGVRYSFLRNLAVDTDGGPNWMLYEALFGTYGSRDGEGNIVASYSDFEKAIQVDGDSIVFNLNEPFAPFLPIIAFYAYGIVDRDFVIQNGGWDGSEATWKDFNGPEEGQETLYEVSSGTGPYSLDRWEKGVEVGFNRNEDYWGPAPAMRKAIYRVVEEWSTRKLMLLQGDADCVRVDPMYYDEMNKEAGITAYTELKELGVRAINFNQAIVATDNPTIYSGKLDGEGIPPDFFTDKNVRLAFSHAWDQETFLRDVINYAGVTTPTPHVSGLPYRDDSLSLYEFDLKKAEEYMRKAWNGQVWEKGFKVDFLYNSGNEVRQNSLLMLAEAVSSLNPKFEINVRAVEWATYVDLQRQRQMAVYMIGWGADYPDPHNFMQPYMHSEGLYGGRCGYNNPEADALIEQGVRETDPAKRKEIYFRLQEIWLEDVVGICQYQPVKNEYFKDWVKGYVFHPMENQHLWSLFEKSY